MSLLWCCVICLGIGDQPLSLCMVDTSVSVTTFVGTNILLGLGPPPCPGRQGDCCTHCAVPICHSFIASLVPVLSIQAKCNGFIFFIYAHWFLFGRVSIVASCVGSVCPLLALIPSGLSSILASEGRLKSFVLLRFLF